MSWPKGISWTKGYEATTTNPDQTTEKIWVHGGFFYFKDWSGNKPDWYCYFGFRPTPTWSSGYGDEGWLGGLARWLKKAGWGNFGIALRFRK